MKKRANKLAYIVFVLIGFDQFKKREDYLLYLKESCSLLSLVEQPYLSIKMDTQNFNNLGRVKQVLQLELVEGTTLLNMFKLKETPRKI